MVSNVVIMYVSNVCMSLFGHCIYFHLMFVHNILVITVYSL